MTSSRRWYVAGAVALLTACAFLPALRNGFAWDDELNFLTNPHYRGLGWEQLRWMFTTAYLGPYQPLSWLSSGLDFSLWGMNPFGYHLGNLLLHAANTSLVYLLSARLLRLAAPTDGPESELRLDVCAGAAALLFSLHPLRVEAVAWATERRTVLAGFFYLSALWFYLEDVSRKRRPVASVVLFLLSLLSKGVGVALPVTLLALDAYPLRRFRKDVLWEKAPFFLLALAFGLVELFAYSQHPTTAPDEALVTRAANACLALVFYAVKTVAPFELSPFYAPAWPIAACVVAVSAVTALLYRQRARWPFALAAWTHYVATLAPVLGIFRFADHLVADRYSYLACLAWPLLAAAGLRSLGRRLFLPFVAATALAVAGLSLLTRTQLGVWRDSITLWRHALTLAPDSDYARRSLGHSYYNLGNARLQRGRPLDAWPFYVESLKHDPANSMAHNNIGTILLKHGTPDDSIRGFRRALELDAGNALAHNGLGLALARKGAFDESVASFCRALRLEPELHGSAANLRALLTRHPRLRKRLDDDCRQRLTTPE